MTVTFDVDTNHIFPEGVLAIIPSIGKAVDVGESRACAGCKWYFLSSPWLSLHCHSLVVGL